MTVLRILMICTMAGTLAVSACGKKGNPERPGQTEEKQQAS